MTKKYSVDSEHGENLRWPTSPETPERDTESRLPIKSFLCLQSSLWIICLLACLCLQFLHLWDSESTLPWLSCLRTGTQILGKTSTKFEPSCKYVHRFKDQRGCHLGSLTLAETGCWLCLHPPQPTKIFFFNAECIHRNVS